MARTLPPWCIAFAQAIIDLPLFLIAAIVLPLNILAYGLKTCCAFFKRKKKLRKPRLLFGVTPIISLCYISRALKKVGYVSETVVIGESSLYSRDQFDHMLVPKGRYPKLLKLFFSHTLAYWFFIRALWKYDIFHFYFDGGLLRQTLFNRFELFLLKCCRKKIVLLPYGSDAFVYDNIPNPLWRHALMIEYGHLGNQSGNIQQRLRRMTKKADIIVACLVHFINLPRWDVLPLTCYPVDTEQLQPVYPQPKQQIYSQQLGFRRGVNRENTGVYIGVNEDVNEGYSCAENARAKSIRIAHACNHRGVKGTAFLMEAVNRLIAEGFHINLDIIEKVPNPVALERMKQCDIYVDQLMFGYAQAALEALSFGKVVISALDNHAEYDLFRTFSYLKECPIVSASPETIYTVLKTLIIDQDKWPLIGQQSRQYVERRHSYQACAALYEAIYQKIWFKNTSIDLINFYHPLREEK